VSQTKAELIKGLNINASAPATALQIDASGNVNIDSNTLYVDATNNRVGIGTTSPNGSLVIRNGSTETEQIILGNSSNTGGRDWRIGRDNAATGDLIIKSSDATNNNVVSERLRIDASGRLLVGTSTALTATTAQYSKNVNIGNSANSAGNAVVTIGRGTAAASLASGNQIGSLYFTDNGAGEFASIDCFVDAAPGAGDYPGRLVFSTTADGASSPTERMRIQSTGTVLINKTNTGFTTSGFEYRSGNELVLTSTTTNISMNRLSSDGELIAFFQDTVQEGSISVSGNTVSYNGAHLSRWSQLPSGAEREEILRGSVLSNLDEMCEWGDEDNEQLNRMKVSDVEGDKNVSGVFQAWDNDDDTYTNDFYCAMTGDFVIRIAGDVTVERGDLLMSAGDGTAKPQDDDIIRSKTIAKVTSTNVSCTYPDGSYCVPCVLMAC
jgi:hypothetical protein